MNYKAIQYWILLFCIFILHQYSLAQKPNNIDSLLQELQKYDSYITYNQKDTSKVKILALIGDFYRYNEPDSALQFYIQALRQAETLNATRLIAQCNNSVGEIYWGKSLYDKALEYALKSIKLYEKLENKKGLASLYNNIGITYAYLQEYDKTTEYILKAIDLYEELGKPAALAASYNNLGCIYLDNKQYQKASDCFLKHINLQTEPGNERVVALSYANLGRACLRIGNNKKAEEYLLKAEEINKSLNEKNGLSYTYNNLSQLYIKSNPEKAINYAKDALTIAKSMENIRHQLEAYNTLSDIYKIQKKYKDAFEYHVLYKQLNDSIFNKDKTQIVSTLHSRYETEGKEKEIELLTKDNRIKSLEITRQKYIRNGSVLISIIIILLAAFIYTRFKIKKRAHKILSKKNTVIYSQKEELSRVLDQLEDANNELEEQKNSLEVIVDERTKELKRAKDLAEESVRFKNAILKNISHEIRTPLNAIVGNSLLISSSEVNDQEKIELGDIINENSDALLHTIENIIEISELESAKYNLDVSKFNLSFLVKDIVDSLQDKVSEHTSLLHDDSISDLVIDCDRNKIGRVLKHVILNAINYTDSGFIKVRYSLVRRKDINIPERIKIDPEINDLVLLEVEDTGIGISPENENLIYESFRKEENHEHKLFRGIGLGLSISKHLLKLLGGGIWHKSKLSGGTIFYFILPHRN